MIVQPPELFLVDHGEMPSLPFNLTKSITQTVTLGKSIRLTLHDLRVDVTLLMQEIQMQHAVQGSGLVEVAQCERKFAFDC